METTHPQLKLLKQLLDDQYTWPAVYLFKFIVRKEFVSALREVFPSENITYNSSSKGNFISLTISIVAQSSDEILSYYTRASSVPTLIAL